MDLVTAVAELVNVVEDPASFRPSEARQVQPDEYGQASASVEVLVQRRRHKQGSESEAGSLAGPGESTLELDRPPVREQAALQGSLPLTWMMQRAGRLLLPQR